MLLIAMPVSKPAWLVTNGKSRFETHWSMRKPVRGVGVVDEARDRQGELAEPAVGSPHRTERSYP